MEGYGLIRLGRGERDRITPRVMRDRVEMDLPLTARTIAHRGAIFDAFRGASSDYQTRQKSEPSF